MKTVAKSKYTSKPINDKNIQKDKQDEAYESSYSKSSSDHLDDDNIIKTDKLFVVRQKLLHQDRQIVIRQWLMIIESYFFWRSCLIIWPKYFNAVEKAEDNEVSIFEELIQLTLALIVVVGIIWSYVSRVYKYEPIKWLLFIQTIQMTITNFHRYRSKSKADEDQIAYKNFQFFNLMSCMYSTIFVCCNCFLIS